MRPGPGVVLSGRGDAWLGGSLHHTSRLPPFSRAFPHECIAHLCVCCWPSSVSAEDLRRAAQLIMSSGGPPDVSCPVLHRDTRLTPTPPPLHPPLASFSILSGDPALLSGAILRSHTDCQKKKTLYISCVVQYFIYSVSLFLYIIFLHG